MVSDEYMNIENELKKLVSDYDYFITNILGVGKTNPFGKEIREYEIQVPYTEFIEHKTDLLKKIEKFRLKLMKTIPSAYNIYASILPNLATDIAGLTDVGSIEVPLRIKMDLELLLEKIKTSIEIGDIQNLLSETYDFDKMSLKIYKDSLKKIASKGEKALILVDTLLRYSSKRNPMSITDLSIKLGKSAKWVKSALKEIREEAPEILRIVMDKNEYKYYIPNTYRKFYLE